VRDLRGGSGNDRLVGGDGDDTLTGGSGTDNMSAGGGNDRFLVSGSDAAADTFNGGAGTDTLQVTGSGSLSLNGFNATTASIESWQGNNQAVIGSTAANTFNFSGLTAKSGISYVDGGSGNDTLVGSAFADDLRGGSGTDRLTGGGGNDTLRGNGGNDTFTFGPGFGQDKIMDFALSGTSADVIQFSAGTFANYTAVRAAMQQVGSDVVITLDAGNTVTIANVTMSQLQSNDFLFS
jgi:Ca2+-binding RTX toxin-like protein